MSNDPSADPFLKARTYLKKFKTKIPQGEHDFLCNALNKTDYLKIYDRIIDALGAKNRWIPRASCGRNVSRND